MAKQPVFKRWYDADPRLSEAMFRLERLSIHSQRLIAAWVNELAAAAPSAAAPGPVRTVSRMKANFKRRWHDQDPVVHSAVNRLLLMDEPARKALGEKMLGPVTLLQACEEGCLARGLGNPEPARLRMLLTLYHQQGRQVATGRLRMMLAQ